MEPTGALGWNADGGLAYLGKLVAGFLSFLAGPAINGAIFGFFLGMLVGLFEDLSIFLHFWEARAYDPAGNTPEWVDDAPVGIRTRALGSTDRDHRPLDHRGAGAEYRGIPFKPYLKSAAPLGFVFAGRCVRLEVERVGTPDTDERLVRRDKFHSEGASEREIGGVVDRQVARVRQMHRTARVLAAKRVFAEGEPFERGPHGEEPLLAEPGVGSQRVQHLEWEERGGVKFHGLCCEVLHYELRFLRSVFFDEPLDDDASVDDQVHTAHPSTLG